MATVYLHIGLPKTGTTAIQNFLWDNQTMLEKHGICYPDLSVHYPRVSFLRNAHFLIASCKTADDGSVTPANGDYSLILNQIAELGARFDKIFLTDEALWAAKSRQPAFWERLRTDLGKRGLSLRIIVYLRRQDSFVQSLYRQKIKVQATGLSFHEFLETFLKDYPLDYYSYLQFLSGVLGRGNLIVRIYEKEQYKENGRFLFFDFLDIFGLKPEDGFSAGQTGLNAPLDASQLELRRLLNTLSEPSPTLSQSFREIRRIAPREGDPPADNSFARPEEQAAYLELFEDSNSQVAREFLGREDGVLFQNSEDSEYSEFHASNDVLLRDTILLYAKSVRRLEEKHQQQEKELEKIRSDLRVVRENVVLYRLKRKFSRLSDPSTPDSP